MQACGDRANCELAYMVDPQRGRKVGGLALAWCTCLQVKAACPCLPCLHGSLHAMAHSPVHSTSRPR